MHKKLGAAEWEMINQALELIHTPWGSKWSFGLALADILKTLTKSESVRVEVLDLRKQTRLPLSPEPVQKRDPAEENFLQELLAVRLESGPKGAELKPARESTEDAFWAWARVVHLGNSWCAAVPVWGADLLLYVSVHSVRPRENSSGAEVLETLLPHLGEAFRRLCKADHPFDATEVMNLLMDRGLTRRECEVVWWLAHGKTNQEIGSILEITVQTVKNHLGKIYPKMGIENRSAALVQLARWTQEK